MFILKFIGSVRDVNFYKSLGSVAISWKSMDFDEFPVRLSFPLAAENAKLPVKCAILTNGSFGG